MEEMNEGDLIYSSSTNPSFFEEGEIEDLRILEMVSTSKRTPTDDTVALSPTSQCGSSPFLILCLLAIVLFSVALAYLYRRHKSQILMWWGSRRRNAASESHNNGLPQYEVNFSTSPDTLLLRRLQIPENRVLLMEEIGEGYFSKVYKGLYTDSSGLSAQVAVKILKENEDAKFEFRSEVEIISSFSHENILKLEGVLLKENQRMPWMVFEYMQHGNLAKLLRNSSQFLRTDDIHPAVRLNELDLIWISSQISCGMVYLSSQHFVHRDLAARNCLVGNNLIVKISDFGMSRDIYSSDYYKVSGSRMLPIRWLAPESLVYGEFSQKSDIWAYGVVLWEIFSLGKIPYFGHSNEQVVAKILQGILLSPPEHCPPLISRIMSGCWKKEPLNRLTFPEVFETLSSYIRDRRQTTPS